MYYDDESDQDNFVIPDKIILPTSAVTKELIADIKANFALGSHSDHGPDHWARVRYNGKILFAYEGGDWPVIELFSFLHDSQRLDEGDDPLHGPRAAEYAEKNNGKLFDLSSSQMAKLTRACEGHTRGETTGDLTVNICWDADRLDLFRVGIIPKPHYLSTKTAKLPEMIHLAKKRSCGASLKEIRADLELFRSQKG